MMEKELSKEAKCTVAALAQYAGQDTLYMRTGGAAGPSRDVFIDNLKLHNQPLRFNRPIKLDYSYRGAVYQTQIQLLATSNGYVVDATVEHGERIHDWYGVRVRELVPDVDSILD